MQVIILNWNSWQETLSLVKELKDITYQNLRILVLDNHSTMDNSAFYLEEAADKIGFELTLNKANLGYAGGNNVGIRFALNYCADYIWILNPDIRVESNALEKMVETMTSSDNIAATGSRICYRKDQNLIYTDGGNLSPEEGYQVTHLHHKMRLPILEDKEIYEVDYANGSSILLNSEAVKVVGNFREDFFLYFEEAEWCLRAKTQGWQILTDTRAKVYHSPSVKGPNYHFYMTRNKIWLSKLDKNRKNYRSTLYLEAGKTLIYLKKNILGTLLFRIHVLWARIRGLIMGITGKVN